MCPQVLLPSTFFSLFSFQGVNFGHLKTNKFKLQIVKLYYKTQKCNENIMFLQWLHTTSLSMALLEFGCGSCYHGLTCMLYVFFLVPKINACPILIIYWFWKQTWSYCRINWIISFSQQLIYKTLLLFTYSKSLDEGYKKCMFQFATFPKRFEAPKS